MNANPMIHDENELKNIIEKIKQDLISGPDVFPVDSMTLLRNLTGTISSNPNLAQIFLECIRGTLLNRSIQILSECLDTIERPLTVSMIFKIVQFWANTLNLNHIHSKNEQELINEFGFVFEPKYYEFLLNLHRRDGFDDQTKNQLKKSSVVFSAILYRICSSSQNVPECFASPENFSDFWHTLLDHIRLEISEWSLWIFFLALERGLGTKLFSLVTGDDRSLLIDICMEFVDDQLKKQKQDSILSKDLDPEQCQKITENLDVKLFDENFVRFLIDFFQNEMKLMLDGGLKETVHQFQAQILCKLSSLLLKICPFESYRKIFQAEKELLHLLIDMLKNFQLLSKTGPDSIFAIQSRPIPDETVNPIHGFKRNIIGLLANVLYKNDEAKEYLRESGGLMALLDSTRIDHNNPFIMQWSIFAIRNALENNQENQNYVSNLEPQGVVRDGIFNNQVRFGNIE